MSIKKFLCLVILGSFISLSGGVAANSSKANASAASINKATGKRKCVKNGGTFYEYADGRKFCVPAQNARKQKPKGNQVKMSDKKKCWKAGGVWITKPEPMGTFCLKKLSATS